MGNAIVHHKYRFTDDELKDAIRAVIQQGQYPSYSRVSREFDVGSCHARFTKLRAALVEQENLQLPKRAPERQGTPEEIEYRRELDRRYRLKHRSHHKDEYKSPIAPRVGIRSPTPPKPPKPKKTPSWAEVDPASDKPLTWRTGMPGVKFEVVVEAVREYHKVYKRWFKSKKKANAVQADSPGS